jgi:MerC mercury resistance protein
MCLRIRYDIQEVAKKPEAHHYSVGDRVSRWKDTLGITASTACAIHCAATPFLIALLPTLKFTSWMASPLFHQTVAVICVGLVAISIWPSFRRYRDYKVLGLSTAGLSLVIAAAFFLPDHCCTHALTRSDAVSGSESLTVVSHSSTSAGTVAGCQCLDHSFLASKRLANGEQLISFSSLTEGSATSDNRDTEILGDDSPSKNSLHALKAGDAADSNTGIPHVHSHTHSTAVSNALASLQPWLTPLGGLLLVMAHGLNLTRRLGCRKRCGCHRSAHAVNQPTVVVMSSTGTRAA